MWNLNLRFIFQIHICFFLLVVVPFSDPCSEESSDGNVTASPGYEDDIWKLRMREIQGAIIIASLFQVKKTSIWKNQMVKKNIYTIFVVQIVIGATGIIGLILRFFGPLVIAPTIALIGLALFGTAADFASDNWYIALM